MRAVGGDFVTFFKSPDAAAVLGIGVSLGLASTAVDDNITTSRMNAELYEDQLSDHFFEAGEMGGGWMVQTALVAGVISAGAMTRNDRVLSLGGELLRAQILRGALTMGLKYTVRRERPDGSNDLSFPSGHTSGSFATATVLHRRLGWKVGAPVFAFASYVGFSRLSENKHYLSDVIVGAAIGIASGRVVTRQHQNTGLSVQPFVGAHGAGVEISVPLP